MKRRVAYPLGCLTILILFLAFIGATHFIEIPFYLAAGWIFFLRDTLPRVTIDRSSVGLAVCAFVVLFIGVHAVGRRWRRSMQSDDGGNSEPADTAVWKMRWTAFLVMGLMLLFTAGISVVGAVHQIAWMTTSGQPLAQNSWEIVYTRSNLKQIGLATHNHSEQYGRFPEGATIDANGRLMHSWMTALLPYVDQQALFQSIDQSVPWNDPINRAPFRAAVPTFCVRALPTHLPNGNASAHFAANQNLYRVGRGFSMKEIGDGVSNTIMAGEVAEQLRAWSDPLNLRDLALGINKHPNGFGSTVVRGNTKGIEVLLADGSVRRLVEYVDPAVLKALSTPNGGEVVGEY